MVTGKAEGTIKPIDRAAVHKICSGQVVLDLATAVKELVENSLDAGATSIDIRLKDYGAELIEVADNGTGVSSENYQGLTLKYHTSKISQFADLQSLTSFGFRGEALSSLCALAKLRIVTRTKDEPVAVCLEYDHLGMIVSQENVARSVGTTVSVSKLFSPLPVRFKEFSRNIRREYGRLLSVLQGYALIAKGVRLICSNQTGKGGRTIVVQSQGNTSTRDNVVTVFGTKTAACMERLEVSVSDSCKVEGFVSKPGAGCGRASGDRQFLYVNGRPVDMPKVAKLLNEIYRSSNSLQYPMFVVNFILPTTAYDVNVTPDKRKLFLHAESELMAALRESLEKVFAPSKYTYTLNNLEAGKLTKVTSTKKQGLVSNMAGSVLKSDTAECDALGGQDLSSDEEDALEDRCRTSVQKDGGEIDSSRVSLGVSSFEQKVTRGWNDKRGQRASGTGSVSSAPPERSLFGLESDNKNKKKLTCVSLSRRPLDISRCGLLTEEPLLKKQRLLNLPDEKTYNDSEGFDKSAEFVAEAINTNTENTTVDSGCPVTRCDAEEIGIALALGDSAVQVNEEGSPSICGLDMDDELVVIKKSSCKTHNEVGGIFSSFISDVDKPERENKKPEPGLNVQNRKELPRAHHQDGIASELRSMMPCSKIGNGLPLDSSSNKEEVGERKRDLESKTADARQQSDALKTQCATKAAGKNVIQTEDLGNLHRERQVIEFDMAKLQKKFDLGLLPNQKSEDRSQKERPPRNKSCFAAATLSGIGKEGFEKEAVLEAATNELERSFNKADFKKMKVLGQFNLGFILAKIDQDIFIIDQHASDEKFNFERLSKTTVLNRQPLLRPLSLELSAAEEIIVVSHMETFRRNGFDFVSNESAPAGQRLQLCAVPFSKNVTFGVGDVQELISLLVDEPFSSSKSSVNHDDGSPDDCLHGKMSSTTSSWLPRPSRVRAMLASRACRSSIMIGDPLSKKQMERILSHLAELDAPWNCPHGRPTMRHLVDLSSIKR